MEKQTQVKIKKIAGIVMNVILWAFVVFAVFITVISVSAVVNKKNVPTIGGKCFLTVQSDSMNADKPSWVSSDKPSGFKTGDLIIGQYIADSEEEKNNLQVGDIITFEADIDGDGNYEYDTHRIVYLPDETHSYYRTQGDNPTYSKRTEDSEGSFDQVSADRIIAKYTGTRIGVVGSVISALNSQLWFGICILLPLACFFLYELFVFIKTVVSVKNEGKKVITQEDEELIKQRAIEEYLKRQAEASGTAESTESESNGKGNDETQADDTVTPPEN